MTCFLLVLPIVYQIYINWLYSRAYLKHIHNNLDEEYLKYDKTLQAIRNGDKTMADSVYNDFFAEAFFANNGQDTVITKFNEMVVKRIEIACIPLCGWKMVYFYFKKRNNILNHRTTINHTNFDTTEIIPKLSDHENNDLEKAVIEYETMPQKPSINEFCNKKHISVKQFKEHRNKRMKLQ